MSGELTADLAWNWSGGHRPSSAFLAGKSRRKQPLPTSTELNLVTDGIPMRTDGKTLTEPPVPSNMATEVRSFPGRKTYFATPWVAKVGDKTWKAVLGSSSRRLIFSTLAGVAQW